MQRFLSKSPLKHFDINIYGSSTVADCLKTCTRDKHLNLVVEDIYPILNESVDLKDNLVVWEFNSDVIPKFHYFVGKHAHKLKERLHSSKFRDAEGMLQIGQ